MWIACTKESFDETILNQEYTRVSSVNEYSDTNHEIEVIYSNRYRPVCRYLEKDNSINYFYWI